MLNYEACCTLKRKMGRVTTRIDLPMTQSKTSSSTVPSSPSSTVDLPVSVNDSTHLSSSCIGSCHDGTSKNIESINGTEDKRASGSFSNFVFGSTPSRFEVESALAALQKFMKWISSYGPTLLSQANVENIGRVINAFRLVQTDLSIKALVVSLATDKAVWDAIMKNESVRKLGESARHKFVRKLGEPSNLAVESGMLSSNEEADLLATGILNWILDFTKSKVAELIEKFQLLVNEAFQACQSKKTSAETGEELEDKLRSSFLLSIMILLIVVVARAQQA